MHSMRGFDSVRLPTTIGLNTVTNTNPKEPKTTSRNDFGFETDISYKNGLPYPVTLIMRNGLALTIPPLTGNLREHSDFIVYVRYKFARNVKIDVHRILDDVRNEDAADLVALRNAINDAKSNFTANSNECLIQYTITRHELEKNGGSIYVDILDCCLTHEKLDAPKATLHPFSREGTAYRKAHENSDSSFHYKLEINDPNDLYGDRFVNLLGRVYRVKAKSDTTKPEGIYIHSTKDVNGEGGDSFLTFESADAELMLFQTAAEAKTFGNLDEVRKREYEQLKHEQQMTLIKMNTDHKTAIHTLEMSLQEYKADKVKREAEFAERLAVIRAREVEIDRENKERDAALKALESSYATAKAERDALMNRERDYYERRSYERKDSSEIIKWAPAAIVGIGLVISKFF